MSRQTAALAVKFQLKADVRPYHESSSCRRAKQSQQAFHTIPTGFRDKARPLTAKTIMFVVSDYKLQSTMTIRKHEEPTKKLVLVAEGSLISCTGSNTSWFKGAGQIMASSNEVNLNSK